MKTIEPVRAQDGDDDNLPGTPWTPPEPSPDGGSPDGDGKHRK